MNEVLFRPIKTTVIHTRRNEEPQADTGNNFFSVSTGNGQSQSTKIVLKRKNFEWMCLKNIDSLVMKSFRDGKIGKIHKDCKDTKLRNFDSAKLSDLVH